MLRSFFCLIGVALVAGVLPVNRTSFAATRPQTGMTAKEAERAFEARYRHANTLKAVFYERYSDGKGAGEAESGTVYFSRPGRMRWEYESPEKKLFIVDGANVWFYIPDDHTASRTKLKESSDWRTPIALLAGKPDLGRICKNIALAATGEPDGTQDPSRTGTDVPGESGNAVLRCTPRASSDQMGEPIRDVLLTIDPRGYLVRVQIQQPGSVSTEFRFGNWQENIRVAETQFHFQPPPGVEIVDEDKLAGQAY
ncbi:MAG TPA: outer membrane lipoprotein carrier protein LolA [Candidatus Acidoferrales bacterium]|nr:outer membrane lipoprotein carrier protein LolA [Candidatus Acidoferrales bacterium]